jgi:hypothetical protein
MTGSSAAPATRNGGFVCLPGSVGCLCSPSRCARSCPHSNGSLRSTSGVAPIRYGCASSSNSPPAANQPYSPTSSTWLARCAPPPACTRRLVQPKQGLPPAARPTPADKRAQRPAQAPGVAGGPLPTARYALALPDRCDRDNSYERRKFQDALLLAIQRMPTRRSTPTGPEAIHQGATHLRQLIRYQGAEQ